MTHAQQNKLLLILGAALLVSLFLVDPASATQVNPELISSVPTDEGGLRSVVGSGSNFILGFIGLLATLGIIIGPLIALVFGIISLASEEKKNKKKYGKIALIGLGLFGGGILAIIVTVFAFAGVNTIF